MTESHVERITTRIADEAAMKWMGGIVLCLVTLPEALMSQSTLVFPKVYSIEELQTTGFAIVNPSSTNATVLFSLYSKVPAGYQLGSDPRIVLSRSSWTVPAKSQFSKLGSELFFSSGGRYPPTGIIYSPVADPSGWIEVTSTVSGLQGFWIGGDFATYTDGADAAPVGRDVVFPLITADAEINITNLTSAVNVNATSHKVTFRLLGKNGTDLAPSSERVIPIQGSFKGPASTLFPNADFSQAMYMRVTSTGSVAGTEVVRGFLVKAESAVLNAINVTASIFNTLNFVHAVSGSSGAANYTTTLGIINLASTAQTVTISFHPEPSGNAVVVQRALQPNGALRESAQSLFGFSSDFENGWIQVSGTAAITGFLAYADLASGGLAAVAVQNTPKASILFDQIAGAPTWYTGIALLNASTTDANVEVFAMTAAGTLVGGPANVPSAAFSLPAGHKIAKVLSDLIPATASQNGGFVYVRTTNNVPLYGAELFGSNVLPILANVAASGLIDGLTYTPPSPSEPLKLTSLLPAQAARSATINLIGNGFAYPPSNNRVVFTTADGTIEVTPATSFLTQLTATVPLTAITGPVVVRTGGQDSSAAILEVTNSDATIIQNPVMITERQVTANADIYVPQINGKVDIQALGVGDVGATQFLVGPFGVEVPRGETRAILVGGNGIGMAMGSKVTISGGGITIDSAPFANGLLVNVTVDRDAEVGPRTLFVTNSNQDMSAVPGGVYIR